MRAFQHLQAPDLRTAVSLLVEPGTEAYAGGTDLLGELKRRIRRVDRLVSLRILRGLGRIRAERGGGLRVGALTAVEEITGHPGVNRKYPILARAASAVGTPQLRGMGTLGGNLCQHPRCWYFRHSRFPCWLKGGERCFTVKGRSHFHAILGAGVCHSVHPSDLAPALISLGAAVILQGPGGKREMLLEDFFRKPQPHPGWGTDLKPGELIVEVRLPPQPKGSRGIFLKAMERKAWSFALASAAAQFRFEGPLFAEGRLILGGVAPLPWRVREAEEILRGQEFSFDLARRAAEAAVAGAKPLRDNGYKIQLVKGLVVQALSSLAGKGGARESGIN